jgi:hypothetical protein
MTRGAGLWAGVAAVPLAPGLVSAPPAMAAGPAKPEAPKTSAPHPGIAHIVNPGQTL